MVQGLNAAFIDIGYEKDAFLHYLDLGPQVQSLNKFTKLALTLEAGKQHLGEFVSAMAVTTIEQCEKIDGFKTVDLPDNLKVRDFKDVTRIYVMSR